MTDLNAQARDILIRNDRGGYTVPTHGLYPYQWNWDSAFVALGFAEFDRNRAWQEIETLISGQWDDGMIPHIIFHKKTQLMKNLFLPLLAFFSVVSACCAWHTVGKPTSNRIRITLLKFIVPPNEKV